MNKLVIHTDGGARGNPGPAAIGVVVADETGKVVHAISEVIGKCTNNFAEYMAVVEALKWVKNNLTMKPALPAGRQFNNETIIHFFLDSALVVHQLNGLFKVKEAHLREFIVKIRILEQEIGYPILYALIPREKNQDADRLVNKALDQESQIIDVKT